MALSHYNAPPKPKGKLLIQTLRIMRLISLFLFVTIMHVSAKTYSQKVTLSLTDVPLKTVFMEINAQTGYNFIYFNETLAATKNVSLHVKNASIEEVLALCFKDQPLSFTVQNNSIVVKAKQNIQQGDTPPINIHGRVTDSLGNPLSGASVFVKGSKNGTITDSKGDFVLKGFNEQKTLVISFTGFVHQEVKLNGQNDLVIKLIRSNNPLDAIVVIPYGTTTQRLNTGDISTVTSKVIEEQPVTNALAALEGRVPGLVITQVTGAPGGGFNVQIRGQNSISNGNEPFYVVDGVPYPSQTLGLINGTLENHNNGVSGSPLNYINPSDIQSIEILKDADATSIYGSRAANGAILITTKKSNGGKMRVDINLCSGLGKITREQQLLNVPQYLQMRREAFYNDSINLGDQTNISDAPDLLFWDTTRYTDWQNLLIGNTAHYDNAQVSVSGGSANTQYFISGGYNRETSVFPVVLPGQGADQKASLHFNMTNNSENRKFKISLTGSYVSDLNTVQANDFTSIAYTLAPDAPPIYNPDGTLNWAPITSGQQGTWSNPYSYLYQKYQGVTNNLIGNALVSYSILPNLQLKASLGYTNTQTNEVKTDPSTAFDPNAGPPYLNSTFNITNTHSWLIEPQAEYHLNLGKGGMLSALAGLTLHENITDAKNIYASGFVSDALLDDIGSAGSLYSTSIGADYKYSAVFGRLNYNYQNKYLLNLTGRRDGSSRFGPGKQFSNFGSIGAAWIFSEEQFFKNDLPFLSFGKIRGSYGTSGNDQIGDYRFLDLYRSTSYNPYQGIQGVYPQNLFNPDLAWELDKKLEAALELGFLQDRIFLSTSVYSNRSGNQLVSEPLSAVSGFTAVYANLPALVQNTGIEIVLNTTNIKSKTFSWKSSINFTIPHNKLVSFPNLQNSPYNNLFIIGQPITINKVYHLIGVNDTTGIYQFSTFKGAPTYNPNYGVDNTSIVNKTPTYYGGFLNSFQWNGFSLDIFFQFTKQVGTNIFYAFGLMPGTLSNQPTAILNHWQKSGDIKPYQQFSQDYSGNSYNGFSIAQASDYAYSDASFVRLKNLSLSYTIPSILNQKWHIQNFRVYIQGQNLLTITRYLGIDPESQALGLPPLRVWTVGFQITL